MTSLRVRLASAPGAAAGRFVSLVREREVTPLHCLVAGTDITCEATGEVAVTAGDRLAIRVDTIAQELPVSGADLMVTLGLSSTSTG